jgi:hypothetical protein
VYTPCSSVSELADPKGLTPELRQPGGTLSIMGGPTTPGVDFTKYTSLFGTHPTTFVPGDPDTAGYGYPGVSWGSVRRPFVNTGRYIALQFRVPTHPDWLGKIGSIQTESYGPSIKPHTIAVAPCPGQFASDPQYPLSSSSTCVAQHGESVYWSIGPNNEGRCVLTPGHTYYLNAITAYFPDLTTSHCNMETCIISLNNAGPPGWPPAQ